MRYNYRDFSKWRVVAHAYYGAEHLLYVGNSIDQVKKNCMGAFYGVLTQHEQMSINRITLEKWNGGPSKGYWTYHDNIKIPKINRSA